MAENSSFMITDNGLWSIPREQNSTETTRSLKTLINEARINHFQHSQLTRYSEYQPLKESFVGGASLPTPIQSKILTSKRSVKPVNSNKTSHATGLRTYNDIVNSGAYTQPDYHPRPTKVRSDEEKDRLAHLMAYGIDPTTVIDQPTPSSHRELDRFDELVVEVEQRKDFLNQMTSLGKRREYQQVIANEIAEKVREMEQIDRQRSKVLEKHLEQFRN